MRPLIVCCFAALALALIVAPGCARTHYYERELLVDRCMQLDADDVVVFIRNKIEGAREGSFGGFGDNAAGGCGCE